MNKNLSQHDQELLKKIRAYDEQGFYEWPNIAHLARQLEDEEQKKRWLDTCTTYNHLEEAAIGDL